MTASQAEAASSRYEYRIPFVIGASSAGTVIEWYDFYLYALLAAVPRAALLPRATRPPRC